MGRSHEEIRYEIEAFLEDMENRSEHYRQQFGIEYFDREREEQNMWQRQKQCFNCGGDYRDFRVAVEDDCPNGVTIQSVLDGVEE